MAMWSSQPLRILNALRVLIRVIWFIWIVTLRLIRLICLLYWDLLRLLWTLVTWWIRSGALRGVKIPRFVLHLSCLFCMRILLVFSRSRRRDIWILDTAVRRLQVIMDLNSLEMAVLREALDLCPPGHTLHILCLDILGPALWNRFHQRGDLELLAEAVELHRQTLDLFPQGHPNHSSCLSNLAAALQGRFEQLGDLDSLAEAVELHRQALNWFPQEHPDRSSSLNNLANALRSQFEQLGDLDSLAEAVELHRQALTLRPPGHPYRSSSLNNLALALQTRFDQMGDLDVLAEAVDLHRQALTLRPQEHPHRSSSLNNLANALQSRFEQLGDRDSLAEAVKLHRQAMILRPHGHPDRSSSLNNLANALQTRFEQLGDLDSLVEAVELHRQAMVLRPQGHPDRSSSLNNLANALQTRFEQLGDLDSLAEAVELHRQALDLFLQGHSNRPSSLSNLAGALQIGFAQLGDLDSLAEAVELHRQAMILRPQGHPDRSSSLNILANALQTRFEQLGDLDSLAEAVELHRQALDLLPPGHSNRPSSLSNLAVALKIRFEQLGDLDSLAEAVGLHRQALDLFLQGHPNRSSSLSNLAAALHNRFQELGEIDSLAEAIELHCQALILRPQGHPDRALSLNNLAIVLQTRFEQLGDLNSLGEAVELHRQALHLRPQGHPGRSSSLNNLARALHTQFQLLDSISDGFEIDLSPHRGLDLEEDLGLLKEGLQSCADGHPMRINFLFHSSHCMLRTGSHAFNFAEAIRHILEALQHGASPARQSLRHSINALRAVEAAYQVLPQPLSETDIGKHRYDDLVLDIYRQTIRLLPRAASFGLDHAGRLRELSSAEAVTRNAATRAITAGRENEAVEMLEEGRGLFWSQALRLRTTDLDLLPVQDAQELRRLFRLLDIRSIGDESTTTPQRERLVEQRRRLSTSAEALISDIRSRPDMSRFLLPPAFSSLMQSLPEGFVVFLNVSELGHHALILNGYAKSVHNLPLTLPARILGTTRKAVNHKSSHARDNDDGLAAQDSVQSVAEQFRAGIREHATFGDSLADLWVYIVKPIINLLQLKVCMILRHSRQTLTENHICRSQAVGTDRVSGGAPRACLPSFRSMLQAATQSQRESVLGPGTTAHLTTLSPRTSPASRRSCEPEMAPTAWHEVTSRAYYCTRAARGVDGPASAT
jgi:tetratricopeptide (TPR) repeat protein